MQSERSIDRIFKRQHGVISREQAVAAGLSARAIDRRVSASKWVRALPGVYRLSSAPQTWMQLVFSAYLWAPDCVVSHGTAGKLYGFESVSSEVVELLSKNGGRRPPEGVRMHFTRILPPSEIAIVSGIRATDPTRTLIDLSSCLSVEDLESALDDALRMELTNVERLVRRLEGLHRGRPGVSKLRRLIDERTIGITESKFETLLFRLIRASGLPLPEKQHRVWVGETFVARIDFAYPALRVGIEADSYRFHFGKPAWQYDLARGNKLAQSGWRMLHFTWDDLVNRPEFVIDVIRETLAVAASELSDAGGS